MNISIRVLCLQLLSIALGSQSQELALGQETVSFSREILPILSDRCFHCHGPDPSTRESDLRLDEFDSATADLGGYRAIDPENPEQSELFARITTDDPDLLMPPPDSHRQPLNAKEQDLVKRWIVQGAPWGKHWAFERPQRPTDDGGVPLTIDELVDRKLGVRGLKRSPPAPPHTLARRLAFALTGLPPDQQFVNELRQENTDHTYEALVDRLLNSPHYGERMAMWWLDAARYADTDGYQQDATRNNWPWRDWVIRSFNDNMRFNDFTIAQFAGDLLPNPSPEQILATCFHRNHMTNGEGGRLPEESRIDYVIDRVNTTGTVWLGLTLGCAQCHSHKFDPISQQDYYRMFAFFDSIDEDGKAGSAAKPYLSYQPPETSDVIAQAQSIVAEREPIESAAKQEAIRQFPDWLNAAREQVENGFTGWSVCQKVVVTSVEGTQFAIDDTATIQATGPNPRQDDYRVVISALPTRVTGVRLEVFPSDNHTDGKLTRGATGEFILTDVKLQVRRRGASQIRDIELDSAVADVEKGAKGRNYGKVADTLDDDPRNGWTTESHDPKTPHRAVFALKDPLTLTEDEELIFVMMHRSTQGDANIGRFRISISDQPGSAVRTLQPMPLEELAQLDHDGLSPADLPPELPAELQKRLMDQFLYDHQAYQRAALSLSLARKQLQAIKKSAKAQQVMVLKQREEARTSYVLERGVWDQKGEPVEPGFPSSIFEYRGPQKSRLDLARWLVSPDNPLTARVVCNQLWQLCFGAGLVRSPEDFGLQGDRPEYPRVLDLLAVELIESGWDIQHVLKLIVTSETYRQDSSSAPSLVENDPDNRWLARGPRFRLPSWMIRDAALQSAGLLNPTIGGPPVMPYQPDGVWAEMFMGRFRYQPSQGALQFRRTAYAFWRRSAAPTFLFDSAQRRVCETRGRLTNTPLHALTLLNDLSLREAARALAVQANDLNQPPGESCNWLLERILNRPMTAQEGSVLQKIQEEALAFYKQNPAEAQQLLDFGQPELHPASAHDSIASYMLVASTILNMDEALNYE